MNSPEPRRRRYESPLRAERAAATRERLIDAGLRVLGADADASLAAVAEAAGVAAPTLYRHFANREALVAAIEERIQARLARGIDPDAARSADTLIAAIPGFYRNYAEVLAEGGEIARGPLAAASRHRRREARVEAVERAFASALAGLDEPERTYLRDVLVLATSSAPLFGFEEILGLPPAEAAERVVWLLRRLTGTRPEEAAGR